MRVLKMIMRALTRKRQRKAVQYFRQFEIVEDAKTVKLSGNTMTSEELTDDFDAVNERIDRRILFELTNRKLSPNDYWDDSDQDSDDPDIFEHRESRVSEHSEALKKIQDESGTGLTNRLRRDKTGF